MFGVASILAQLDELTVVGISPPDIGRMIRVMLDGEYSVRVRYVNDLFRGVGEDESPDRAILALHLECKSWGRVIVPPGGETSPPRVPLRVLSLVVDGQAAYELLLIRDGEMLLVRVGMAI